MSSSKTRGIENLDGKASGCQVSINIADYSCGLYSRELRMTLWSDKDHVSVDLKRFTKRDKVFRKAEARQVKAQKALDKKRRLKEVADLKIKQAEWRKRKYKLRMSVDHLATTHFANNTCGYCVASMNLIIWKCRCHCFVRLNKLVLGEDSPEEQVEGKTRWLAKSGDWGEFKLRWELMWETDRAFVQRPVFYPCNDYTLTPLPDSYWQSVDQNKMNDSEVEDFPVEIIEEIQDAIPDEAVELESEVTWGLEPEVIREGERDWVVYYKPNPHSYPPLPTGPFVYSDLEDSITTTWGTTRDSFAFPDEEIRHRGQMRIKPRKDPAKSADRIDLTSEVTPSVTPVGVPSPSEIDSHLAVVGMSWEPRSKPQSVTGGVR